MSKKKKELNSRVVLKKEALQLEESFKRTHALSLSNDSDLDLLKKFEYFRNITKNVREGDRFIIRKKDLSYYAEALVMKRTENVGIKLHILCEHDLSDLKSVPKRSDSSDDPGFYIPEGYSVKWGGPHNKYQVIYGSSVMEKNFENKQDAYDFLGKHLESIS